MKVRVDDLQKFKRKALQWASSYEVFCCLDSNDFHDQYSKFDFLLAAGVDNDIIVNSASGFSVLEDFRKEQAGWITGFLTYDLKNEVEYLSSSNLDGLHFPDLYFFAPKHLILVKNGWKW